MVPVFKQIQNKLQNFLLAKSPSFTHRKSSLMERFDRRERVVEAAEARDNDNNNNNSADDDDAHRNRDIVSMDGICLWMDFVSLLLGRGCL